ncbi:MAG: J domain-containing protein [Candidatus Dormibacteria bacterium]
MRGILGLIAGKKELSGLDRKRLLVLGTAMHREGKRTSDIEATLEEQGAEHEVARTMCVEARLQFEAEVVRHVPLPVTASAGINYYFALGVTPRASTDRIRRAYRMRAREIHPDRHQQDLDRDLWGQLMTIVTDAYHVLTDEHLRRAYDVHWLRRSRRTTAQWATAKERRGDWETRYHWYMAEVAEMEDNVEIILDHLRERLESGQVLDEGLLSLLTATDLYEERVLQVRLDALGVPGAYRRLAERARLEMVRKDRLVSMLVTLPGRLPRGPYSMVERDGALEVLAASAETRSLVREAHRRFEIAALKESVG